MNRLDTVLGPENWWDEYFAGENSVLCRLTIRLPDGQELTKSDAGGYAGMKDQGDDDKSGHSDAFKRAAVKFGVARYLYRDGVPDYRAAAGAPAREPGADDGPAPTVAPPPVSRPEAARREPHGQRAQPRHGCPRDGKALYRWARDTQEASDKDVVKWLQTWGKRQGYPARMVDWSHDQVALGWDAACRKLQSQSCPSNGTHA